MSTEKTHRISIIVLNNFVSISTFFRTCTKEQRVEHKELKDDSPSVPQRRHLHFLFLCRSFTYTKEGRSVLV